MKKLLGAFAVFATLAFALPAFATPISNIESFAPTDTDGVNDNSNGIVVAKAVRRSENVSFGFYLVDTATNVIESSMEIFGNSSHFLSTSTVAWNFYDESQYGTASNGQVLDASGENSFWQLGAYVADNGVYHYSHAALNAAGDNQLQVTNSTFWDGALDFIWSGDHRQNMYVTMTDLEPGYAFGIPLQLGNPGTSVPEPSALLLFGIGLAGLGLTRRRAKMDKAIAA